ncbi:hypothetical protein DIPPA_15999 [Diplonema papillatum]|nr:hypothetical protein DIPPA_15999 [Diplonema papillatum]
MRCGLSVIHLAFCFAAAELVQPRRAQCCPAEKEPGANGNNICFEGFGERCESKEPKCCPAEKEPGASGNNICFEGHQCCPDGTWSCSIGDGVTFSCGGAAVTSGFGKKCAAAEQPCCPARTEPGKYGAPACFGKPRCCRDGTWSCSGFGAHGFVCGGKLGFGRRCKRPQE